MTHAALAGRQLGHRQIFVPLVTGLAALSWLTLWRLGASPAGGYLHHHEAASSGLVALVVAVGGWALMTTAMMLPTTLPLVRLFERVTSTKPDQAALMTLLIAGYVLVWTSFGLSTRRFVDWCAERLEELLPVHRWLVAHITASPEKS